MDLSEKPSVRHPMGVAVCGTPIVPGLVVFTNEMRVGVVQPPRYRPGPEGWFDVAYPGGGGTVMQNPERVATRFRTYDGRVLVAAEEQEGHHE